jgi:sugar phosphate isomerase/epimerase
MQLCLKAKYVSADPAARLDYCRQVGFEATQETAKSIPGAVERGWPTVDELWALKAPFDDAGVAVIGLEPVREPVREWADETPSGRAAFDVLARHLDAAGAVGIPCVTLHPPLDSAEGADEAARQFELNARFYERAAGRAREAGTRLATHSPYPPRKGLWSGREYGSLFDAVPDQANGMIYCFGCMAMACGDPVRALEELPRFLDRILFVHVRDVVMHADGTFDEVLPGRGDVRPEEAIRRLWRLGYRGPLTPEHLPPLYGEPYSGAISTAWSAGWTLALIKELRAAEVVAPTEVQRG